MAAVDAPVVVLLARREGHDERDLLLHNTCKRSDARDRVCNVVVRSRSVIHRVFAGAARASLKADELRDHARAIEQVETT